LVSSAAPPSIELCVVAKPLAVELASVRACLLTGDNRHRVHENVTHTTSRANRTFQQLLVDRIEQPQHELVRVLLSLPAC